MDKERARRVVEAVEAMGSEPAKRVVQAVAEQLDGLAAQVWAFGMARGSRWAVAVVSQMGAELALGAAQLYEEGAGTQGHASSGNSSRWNTYSSCSLRIQKSLSAG